MQITTNHLTFNLKQGETLLEGLERTGHQVEYQCRSGYCGSCRLALEEGEIDYQLAPLAMLRKNEFLPCCSTATSNLTLATELVLKKSRLAS